MLNNKSKYGPDFKFQQYINSKDYQGLKAYFLSLINENHDNPIVLEMYGKALISTKEYKEAHKIFKELNSKNNKFSELIKILIDLINFPSDFKKYYKECNDIPDNWAEIFLINHITNQEVFIYLI